MIPIILDLLSCVLSPRIYSTLVNILCTFEKKICILLLLSDHSVSIYKDQFFISTVSAFQNPTYFFSICSSIIQRGMLTSPPVIVDLYISLYFYHCVSVILKLCCWVQIPLWDCYVLLIFDSFVIMKYASSSLAIFLVLKPIFSDSK